MLSQVLWNSPRSLPVAAAVALLTVVAVVWLYPAQVKGLSFGWRWGLPVLRAMGLLALAGALLKPVVLRPKSADERAAVVVLVDRSRSMAVADRARTAAQRVALAAGMGRLAPGVRKEEAAAVAARAGEVRPLLAAAERAAGDLEYARVAGRGVEAARERARVAMQRVREGLATAGRAAEALGDASVKAQLAEGLELPAVESAGLAAALVAARAKLDAAAAAATQLQAAADEKLYQSDAGVREACDALAGMSRFELALEAVLRPGEGLAAKLGREATVVGYAFADDLTPLPLSVRQSEGDGTRPVAQPATGPASAPTTGPTTAPTSAPATSPTSAPTSGPAIGPVVSLGSAGASPSLVVESLRVPGVSPDGRRSDVAGSVRRVLERFEGRDLAAVVVLSDGRQVGGDGAVTSALAASGTPVYAVSVAPAGAVRDVSIGGVTAPNTAFVGETATVRAEVRPRGIGEGQARVKLVAEGGGEQVREVKWAEGKPAAAEFQVKLQRPGAQLLTVALEEVVGEATAENNVSRRWVKVLSQKVRVAAYAGVPGWDFQYLRNALGRTAWVELRSAVLGPGGAKVPLSAEEMLRQDVVVLADVPVGALDNALWDALYRLVAERGGSVVLLAGVAHVPGEYGDHLVASSLLPYPPELTPTWRTWPGEEAMFRLAPDAAFADDPVLRLGGAEGGASAVQRWQMLPGFYRVLPVGRLKAGAQAMLVEASSGEPILTQVRVGAGRSFLLGADETWRWRGAAREDVHERFWLQLLRYAAGERYAVRNERLALDVDRVAVEAGGTAQVKVRATPGTPVEALALHLVKENVGKSLQIPMTPTDAAGGRFGATAGPLAEGEYEVRLTERGAAGEGGALAVPLRVVATFDRELADVSGDDAVLARLADASGGDLLRLEQLERLTERTGVAAAHRPGSVEQPLWDSPYLFVLVVACFAAEWAARKRLGLA